MCPHGTQITINQLQILVISNDYVHKAQNQFLGKTKKLGKTKQLLKDAREQPIDLHKATMDDKTISKNLGDKVTAAGVIQKWKKYKTLCQPQSIQDLPSLGEDDHEKGDRSGQKYTGGAVGTKVTKNIIDSTQQEFPLFNKAHLQAHLKFASEQLNNSEKACMKVLWSNET